MKKRIATPFLSHEEWTSSIKEDYNYIKKHFKHPERLHIEYSKYFGFHLNMLFRDMRNNFFNNLKTNFKKVPHWMIFFSKSCILNITILTQNLLHYISYTI